MYLLSIPQQLDTLLSNLVKANLSEEEVQECKKASMTIPQININLHDNQAMILGSNSKYTILSNMNISMVMYLKQERKSLNRIPHMFELEAYGWKLRERTTVYPAATLNVIKSYIKLHTCITEKGIIKYKLKIRYKQR